VVQALITFMAMVVLILSVVVQVPIGFTVVMVQTP